MVAQGALILGVLLAAGFACAKLAQRLRLPSVTGYILAGALLGPSGLDLFTPEALTKDLGHFSQLAIMLIAFGVGEHLEWAKLRSALKRVTLVGLGETSLAFACVASACYLAASLGGLGPATWRASDYLALAALLGAVSVATAPATTMHVLRELRAAGPLTNAVMTAIAVNNAVALAVFGLAMGAAGQLTGAAGGSLWAAVGVSLADSALSLGLGLCAGLAIAMTTRRLRRRGEMLTAGLALLLLCGVTALWLGLSPLLAGMAAGCLIVNRRQRDVRLFRAINDFEPPIYVLFFTMAGASLHLGALAAAGGVSLVYFVARALGKVSGAWLGASLAGAKAKVRRYLGLALLSQADVAIGLIFILRGDGQLADLAQVITPVVLGGVVLAEVLGPISARWAIGRAGEDEAALGPSAAAACPVVGPDAQNGYPLTPWTWERLTPPPQPRGQVLFVLGDARTAAVLARLAAIIAHGGQASPTAMRVLPPGDNGPQSQTLSMLTTAAEQIRSMGGAMASEIVASAEPALAIVRQARAGRTMAILLAQPPDNAAREFKRFLDELIELAPCPVIVARPCGALHTERILAPVADRADLRALAPLVRALSSVGHHRITLMTMLASNALDEELEDAEDELDQWARQEDLAPVVRGLAVAAENRAQAIVAEAQRHDLLVMTVDGGGWQGLFFGSLAQEVQARCQRPLLLVHRGGAAADGSAPV